MSVATELAIAEIRKELENFDYPEVQKILSEVLRHEGFSVASSLVSNDCTFDDFESIDIEDDENEKSNKVISITDMVEFMTSIFSQCGDVKFDCFMTVEEDPNDMCNEELVEVDAYYQRDLEETYALFVRS